MTKSEFSRYSGVARPSIYKAIDKNRLVTTKTGKLDVTNQINADFVLAHSGKTVTPPPEPKKPTKKVSKRRPPIQNAETFDLNNLPRDLETLSASSANKLKTIEQIRQYQVKTDEMRKELVKRDTVRAVFSKLYMIDVNQWRTLGPAVAPELAAIAGTDDEETILRMANEIEKEVFKILKQCKRLLNDYLVGVKSEVIK